MSDTVESFDNQVSLENFNNITQRAQFISKSSFCAIGIVDHFQDVPAMSITIERSTESIVVVNVPNSKPIYKAIVTNATQNMNRPLLVLTNVGKVSSELENKSFSFKENCNVFQENCILFYY